MKLILQCSVCGTVNAVGLPDCGTCRATGVESLRLLFECPRCFKLDLQPECVACSKLLSLGEPYEVVEDPVVDPAELARLWGVNEDDESAASEPLDPMWVDEPPKAEVMLSLDETAELRLPELELGTEETKPAG